MKHASTLVTLYAAALLIFGGALLFAPEALAVAAGPAGPGHVIFAQLLGAALIGFAAANWIARRSPLGGIYGRAVVLGNQVFALVGTLALLGSIPEDPGTGFWLLLALLASGAVLFGVLLLRGPQPGSDAGG